MAHLEEFMGVDLQDFMPLQVSFTIKDFPLQEKYQILCQTV